MMPKISVITVCFNAEKYIEQTIQSVIEQDGVDFEYIIIDGGSKDETLEIIKKYDSDLTEWISEPDNGIADAMNKGISRASGDYILFLHADDYLASPTSMSEAIAYCENNADIDVYAFDILYQSNNEKTIKQTRPFGLRTYFKTPVMHQGALCSKEILDKLGGFNTSYEIAMDYDFFLRAYRHGAKIKIIHHVLSVMRDTGISSKKDWGSLQKRFSEEKMVHLNNMPENTMRLIYAIYWPLYIAYRRLIYKAAS